MHHKQNTDLLYEMQMMLAHHERQIDDLSEMLRQQWHEIDNLKRQLERANAKIGELETIDPNAKPLSVSEMAAMEKPPHY